MAEDSFLATREGKFRGSRYPGFVGGGGVDSTGVGSGGGAASVLPGDTSGAATASKSLSAQTFDIPEVKVPGIGDMAGDLGQMAVSGAGQYATTQIGANAGRALASGAATGVGDALSYGVNQTVSDVGRMVGIGANAGTKVYDTVASVGPLASEASNLGSQAVSGGAAQAGGAAASAPAATSGMDAGISQLSDGANIGGAAGAGIGRAAIGIAMGEKPSAALRAGAGSAVGYYAGTAIGTAIGGPVGGVIGGFLGSTVGSIFCFAAGTMIMMADGSFKAIETLDIDDEVMLGGKVTACGKAKALDGIYRYRGEVVSGGHAVFENGEWLRVEDSVLAMKMTVKDGFLVYPVCTEHRLLVTTRFIAADMEEIERTWEHTESERIHILNLDAVRNGLLRADERRLKLAA